MKRVLIITRSDDNASVKMVSEALSKRGAEAIRLDSDWYPMRVQISTEQNGRKRRRVLRSKESEVSLDDLTAVYHRRFFAGGRLPASLGDMREASVNEARRTLYGTIAGLGCFELDPWVAVRKTDHKELQLMRGAELGLDVPRTLFSNDPEQVRRFAASLDGPMITKMQSSFAIYRDGQEQVVFTNEVTEADLADLDGLRFCPMTFQEKLPKHVELRATVVGKQVFCASIDSQKQALSSLDWRRDGAGLISDWTPYELPKEVKASLLALTADFGLNYAAADFVVTPDGRHVFLEINAGGEWFWLQRAPGLPIAEAIAETLLGNVERALCAVK